MTIPLEAPADRRSLAASAAIGACVGLAIGSAYIAGALARGAVEDAQAKLVAGSSAVAAPRLRAPIDASAPVALARATTSAPRLTHVDLRGPVAPARDLECLSQAVYYEARGEAERGRQAVAQVVMNRAHHPRYPRSICGVVFQHASSGCAFSFACDGQTRHALEPAAWRDARRIAQRTLAGFVLPDVRTATDFRSGGGGTPIGLERVAQIGAHVFYRFTGRGSHAVAWSAPQHATAPSVPQLPDPRAPTSTITPAAPVIIKADAPVKTDAAPATPTA